VAGFQAEHERAKARLCDEGRLRPNISVVVDGTVSTLRLRHQLSETSEVHFLPAIGGGGFDLGLTGRPVRLWSPFVKFDLRLTFRQLTLGASQDQFESFRGDLRYT